MLPAGYYAQNKSLAFALNAGTPGSISLIAFLHANNINTAAQRRIAQQLPLVRAQQLDMVSGIESLFQLNVAYWCALSQVLNENTPSS